MSLDILRGLTVALMILVNNGAGEEIYAGLQHSKWNGLTPCDFVFPFFLFMMGMSTFLSLRKSNFTPSAHIYRKIAKRTFLLFVIGLAINWFDMACGGRPLDFAHLRIWGVMQRIALCYGVVSVLAITVKHRFFMPLIIILLALYTAILIFGNGYAYDAEVNSLAQVDLHLFGYDHLYHKSPVDPEGLVSTLSSIAHTMIGFWCCSKIQKAGQSIQEKTRFLIFFAVASIVMGCILHALGIESNKRIWSTSFVLLTCGAAAAVLACLVRWIDTNANGTPSMLRTAFVTPCLIFGTNPLFLYVASEALAIIFGVVGIKDGSYAAIHSIVTDGYVASLIYSLLFVALHLAMGAWLYRKRIFIKI